MAAQGLQKKLPFQEQPHFNSPGIWIPELSRGKHQLQPLPAPKSLFVWKQSIIPFFDISDDKVQEQINTAPVPNEPKSRQGIIPHRFLHFSHSAPPKPTISCRKGNLEVENGDATSKVFLFPLLSPRGQFVPVTSTSGKILVFFPKADFSVSPCT